MTETFCILSLLLLGAGLIVAGASIILGTGAALITAGVFSLLAAVLISRGVANVPNG